MRARSKFAWPAIHSPPETTASGSIDPLIAYPAVAAKGDSVPQRDRADSEPGKEVVVGPCRAPTTTGGWGLADMPCLPDDAAASVAARVAEDWSIAVVDGLQARRSRARQLGVCPAEGCKRTGGRCRDGRGICVARRRFGDAGMVGDRSAADRHDGAERRHAGQSAGPPAARRMVYRLHR